MLTDLKQVITDDLQFQNQLHQKKKPKQLLQRRVRSDFKLKGSMWVYSTLIMPEKMLYSVFVIIITTLLYILYVWICVHLYFILYICTVCVQEPTVTKTKVKPSVAKKGKDNRKMMAKLFNQFSY